MSEKGREISLSEGGKKKTILDLKKRIRDEKSLRNFPCEDEGYLERFLGGTSYNVEDAYDRIKTYYEMLLEYPEWFTKEPPLLKKVLIEKDMRIALPETDKDGRPIYIAKLGNIDPTTMTLLEVVSIDDIWVESILLKFPSEKGLCVIIDIKNLSWRCLKWLTPYNITIALKKLQCLPFKDFRFHIVNESWPVHAGIKIVWPFLSQQIKDMVKFHFSDRKSLHSFIDPQMLPDEYGGQNGKINYNDLYDQLYAENQQIFENFTNYKSLEKIA